MRPIEHKTLDAAVVIPSHREGTDVVHTLASIARQQGLQGRRIGVFVVINNARGAVQDVVSANMETAGLVRALGRGELPPLSGEPREVHSLAPDFDTFGNVSISDRGAANQVLHAPFLHLAEVNLWEGDHAPEVCNVGVARHLGTQAAIPFLRDKSGVIMHRDADMLLHPWNMGTILSIFSKRPDVALVQCKLYEFLPRGMDAEALAQNRWECYGYLQRLTQEYLNLLIAEKSEAFYKEIKGKAPLIKKVEVPVHERFEVDSDQRVHVTEPLKINGADLNFRASLYDKIQFQLIPGEEDTRFVEAVSALHRIVSDIRVKVAARVRFSQRATTGHGQGLLRFSQNDLASYPHTSVLAQEFIAELFDIVMNRLKVAPTDNITDFRITLRQLGMDTRYGLTKEDTRELFHQCIHRGGGQIGITGELLTFVERKFPSTVQQVLGELKENLRKRANKPKAKSLLEAVERLERVLRSFDARPHP